MYYAQLAYQQTHSDCVRILSPLKMAPYAFSRNLSCLIKMVSSFTLIIWGIEITSSSQVTELVKFLHLSRSSFAALFLHYYHHPQIHLGLPEQYYSVIITPDQVAILTVNSRSEDCSLL